MPEMTSVTHKCTSFLKMTERGNDISFFLSTSADVYNFDSTINPNYIDYCIVILTPPSPLFFLSYSYLFFSPLFLLLHPHHHSSLFVKTHTFSIYTDSSLYKEHLYTCSFMELDA